MLLNSVNDAFSYNALRYKNMDGSATSYQVPLANLSAYNSSCTYGGIGGSACHVMIGAGTTTPTKSDYDLADTSIIGTDKMKPIAQTAVYSDSTGASITTSWQNMSGSAITVKEVGLAYKHSNGGGEYNKAHNILISRKVLDNPVTINSGETYIFTYNIKI